MKSPVDTGSISIIYIIYFNIREADFLYKRSK